MAASDRILVDMGQYAGILPTTLDRPQNTWLLCGDAGGSASDDANCDRSLSGLRWLRIVASPMRSGSVPSTARLSELRSARRATASYSHARLQDLQGALKSLPDLKRPQPNKDSLAATDTDDNRRAKSQRRSQQTKRGASQSPANGCDQETRRASAPGKDDARPNVFSTADLGHVVQPNAASNQSGGHEIRTRNPLRGTSFPMRPLAIRLPSERHS